MMARMFTRYDLMGYGFGLSAVLILMGFGVSLPQLLLVFFLIVTATRMYGQRKGGPDGRGNGRRDAGRGDAGLADGRGDHDSREVR